MHKKVFCNWCLFSLLVLLVNGLSIPRGVARKFSTAVDLFSSPTVTWKSPTALHVMSIDTGSDNNNATSSTSMAGGYGDPVTRLDYQVNNAEERLRREQETALGSVLNLLSDLRNEMSTKMDKMESKMESKMDKMNSKMDTLSKDVSALNTQFIVSFGILGIILLAISIQIPFLKDFASVLLKFIK
jgi:hypothetical protein